MTARNSFNDVVSVVEKEFHVCNVYWGGIGHRIEVYPPIERDSFKRAAAHLEDVTIVLNYLVMRGWKIAGMSGTKEKYIWTLTK